MLLRGNGTPMFLLANVVDDIEMGITHVVRAEEHLPEHAQAAAAVGGARPRAAGVGARAGARQRERKKLSKRRDKVALEQYRDEGYLADAMVNYLMTLGWAPKGDTEIVPWARIEDEFRLEDVTHSPAFFDLKKLTAFNGEYIRALPVDEFVAACEPWLPAALRPRRASPRIAPRAADAGSSTLAEAPRRWSTSCSPTSRRSTRRRGTRRWPRRGPARCSTT